MCNFFLQQMRVTKKSSHGVIFSCSKRVYKKSSSHVNFFCRNACYGLIQLTAKKEHNVTIFLLQAFTAKKNSTDYNIHAYHVPNHALAKKAAKWSLNAFA